MKKVRLAAVLAGLIGVSAFASSGRAQDRPTPVVLRAARLFDGHSDALIEPGLVVVEGEEIVAVGSEADVPDAAKVIDLGDATLCPGFIDCHTHLTAQLDAPFDTMVVRGLRRTVPEKTLYAAAYARRTVEAGFTTVRDVGADDLIDIGLRNGIEAGLVPGPRMLASGGGLGARGGHTDITGFRPDAFGEETGLADGIAVGPDGFRDAVRYRVKYGADVIKFHASGGVLSPGDEVDTPQLTLEEMTALIDEAHNLRKTVAAHCHGDTAAKLAIRAGVDSLEHGSFLKPETLRMMKEHGTYLVPTLMAGHSLEDRIETEFPPEIAAKGLKAIESVDRMFQQALEIGVPIAFGTDAGVFEHGRNAEEFALMVGLGMDPIAALKSATASAADLIGMEDELGTLEAGKLADIIALPGDPTEDITVTERVFFVMKEGQVVENERGE